MKEHFNKIRSNLVSLLKDINRKLLMRALEDCSLDKEKIRGQESPDSRCCVVTCGGIKGSSSNEHK